MNLTTHVTYNGQCEAAFKFYERCLGGKIRSMLAWGSTPMAKHAPPGWGEKILHASLLIGDDVLAGADVLPEQYEQPKGFAVLLGVEDPADAERVFHALAENGKVLMEIQKTFWAARFGVLIDQYGVPWEINCEQAP